MILRRFYDDGLAQASFLIGCQATGEAIVVDPHRDVDQYIAAAEADGLEIRYVTETHIHADFVSGARELGARTGAVLALSHAGPPEWQYAFMGAPGTRPLVHGDRIHIGNIVIEAVHTPGHTPEHLCFLVTDGAATAEPMGILTGDFVFVGDVGRPDLLEKAARVSGASDASARALFRSLQWFRGLADHLQVWPGHGAGSACGKGIGAVPQSTVGYERRVNWALGIEEEEEFVRQVLLGQPEPPRYFGIMKRINRAGPPVLGTFPTPERIAESRLAAAMQAGALLVDTRSAAEFAVEHIPGSVNLPLNRSFATYAGSVLPYDRDLVLLGDIAPDRVRAAVRSLLLIGLDRVVGYAGGEALATWVAAGHALSSTPQITSEDLLSQARRPAILDVRGEGEWKAGHIPGALLIPLPELADRIEDVPSDSTVIVQCQSGARSAVAASLLASVGRRSVVNLVGGFAAWQRAGGPVERGS